jgi:hypothetical protein
MRHNRGSRRRKFRNNFPSSNNNSRPISFKNKNLTYIGRCRCGYGPNAYYQTPEGNIIHANQVNQPQSPNISDQRRVPTSIQRLETQSSPIEMYRICNQCGARIRDDAYFCTECGNAVGSPDEPTKKEKINTLKERIKEIKTQIKQIKKNE